MDVKSCAIPDKEGAHPLGHTCPETPYRGKMVRILKKINSFHNFIWEKTMIRLLNKAQRKSNLLFWIVLLGSGSLMGMEKNMLEPLIRVKIVDPSIKSVFIQAEFKSLGKGDHFIFFKGPGINTEPKKFVIRDNGGELIEWVQLPQGKVHFRTDSPKDIFINYEIDLENIFSTEKRLLLLLDQSLFLYAPENWNPISVIFDLPKDREVLSTAKKSPDGSFRFSDVREGRFLLADFQAHFDVEEIHL